MEVKQNTTDYMVKKMEDEGFNQALTNLEKYDHGEYKPRPIEEIEKVISMINGKKIMFVLDVYDFCDRALVINKQVSQFKQGIFKDRGTFEAVIAKCVYIVRVE